LIIKKPNGIIRYQLIGNCGMHQSMMKKFFEDHSTPHLTRLKEKQQQVMTKLNQPIHIRDLILQTDATGETQHTSRTPSTAAQRLRAHILFLFNLVNEDHRSNYCQQDNEGHYTLKKNKENHVTRLLMNECSLYTNKPLSIAAFHCLYQDIEKMAEILEPNVHVLLSSFSVKDPQSKLLNMLIFIEGGRPPIMHSFAKNMASNLDIIYDKKEILFCQQAITSSFHANYVASKEGLLISMDSVFEITTQGGATYTQAIDVCLDHMYGHSKHLLMRRIASSDTLLPEQVEQCVTSDTVDIQMGNSLATHVVHADLNYSMHDDYKADLGLRPLTAEIRTRIIPNEFSTMRVVLDRNGYKIFQPIFGNDCVIEVLHERLAARYKPEWEDLINYHNAQVCAQQNNQLKIIIETINKNLDDLTQQILCLKQNFLQQYKPSFWLRWVNTAEKMAFEKIASEKTTKILAIIKAYKIKPLWLNEHWKKELLSELNSLDLLSNEHQTTLIKSLS